MFLMLAIYCNVHRSEQTKVPHKYYIFVFLPGCDIFLKAYLKYPKAYFTLYKLLQYLSPKAIIH